MGGNFPEGPRTGSSKVHATGRLKKENHRRIRNPGVNLLKGRSLNVRWNPASRKVWVFLAERAKVKNGV